MSVTQKLSDFNVTIDIERLVSEQPELEGAEKKLGELQKLIRPKLFWRELQVNEIENSIITFDDGKLTLESAYVSLGLKDCRKATLIAVTIDKNLPRYTKECLEQGKLWEATITDIFGSNAVEALVEDFHRYLSRSYLPKGLYSTLRFSPGYGDWQLAEQKNILAYLDTGDIIKATDSFMLEPVKSITALIGWSSSPGKKKYPQGDKKRGVCHGQGSCEFCQTWACRKD